MIVEFFFLWWLHVWGFQIGSGIALAMQRRRETKMKARNLAIHIRANKNVRTATAEQFAELLDDLDEIAAEEAVEYEAENAKRKAERESVRLWREEKKDRGPSS